MRISQHNLVIEERALRLGEKFVLCKESTVRSLAKEEKMAKSTVYKDLTGYLKEIDRTLYEEVKSKLELNKAERHIRGGESTKQKYLKLDESR